MSYQAGDTYPATLTVRDDEGNLVDPPTLTLKVRDEAGTVTAYEYPADTIIGRDSLGKYHADVLLDTAGMWVIEWSTTDEEQVEGIQIAVSPEPTVGVTLATLDELAVGGLGKASAADLTAAQAAQGRMLLELVTGLIVDAVGKTDEWLSTLVPVPRLLRAVCIAAVARVMQNPEGGSSATTSETLGAYSYSNTTRFENRDGSAGTLGLTDAEIRMLRGAVYGRRSGTFMPGTTVDLVLELAETGEIAEFPAT